MTNGDLLDEVEILLSKKQLPTASALRLMLKLQKQQFETMEMLSIKEDDLHKEHNELKERVKTIEDISIVRWVGRHPKVTGIIVGGIVFLTSYVDIRELVKYLLTLGMGAH